MAIDYVTGTTETNFMRLEEIFGVIFLTIYNTSAKKLKNEKKKTSTLCDLKN